MTQTPLNLIAVCGWPGAGKDEIANTLNLLYGFRRIDDGLCLRQAVPYLFDCNSVDPFTREGKDKIVDTVEGRKSVRYLLGTLGDALEDYFGEFFMPYNAVRQARQVEEEEGNRNFVFPSVRKNQGVYYKRQGGYVVEVERPGIEPSSHKFDQWNRDIVDAVIVNDGTVEDLKNSAARLMLNLDRLLTHTLRIHANGNTVMRRRP